MTSQPSPPGPARPLLRSATSGPLWSALTMTLGLTLSASADLPPDLQSGPRTAPPPICRVGYLEFEAARGLEGVRAAVEQAHAQKDQAALDFLRERLTERIGKEASTALQVVKWAEAVAAPEASLYLQALRGAEAAREPSVVSRLMALAENDSAPGHQALAMEALETQHRFEPKVLERLTTLAKRETSLPGVAMHAARAIGRVMANEFERTGRFEPYQSRLLEVAQEAPRPAVRSLAVEMITQLGARLDGTTVERIAKRLREDPDPGVREMAALALSSGRDTQAVLRHFREAWRTEKERCVRWALVFYAVRAAGAQALPLLRDLVRTDRRFQQDYAEFKALYDAGHVDFDRLWLNKKVRHPSCQVSDP